ncbi:PilZ domain-containing protein [Hyphomicrobium sp. 99]|uniref:PilZ domain-containing protein n=1 Tax=Hyphomicrobium sp. 99 TaxID=1163419 RepID=UPI001FDA7FC7|nr:PilZ domain-containing protein [Hyphomicrobium sp. 99]
MALARIFLRRRDDRQRVSFTAILECRGVAQNVQVVDFSISGLRVDGIQGLAAGDPIEISFTPDMLLTGEIVWSVWHKAGIKLLPPLDEAHPAYLFLSEQASALEQLRVRAISALANRARSADRSGEGSP